MNCSDVRVNDATTVLVLSDAMPDVPLFRIVNRSESTVLVHQRGEPSQLVVDAGREAPFAWHEPEPRDRRLIVLGVAGLSRCISVQPDLLNCRYVLRRRSGARSAIVCDTVADGPTRTLLVHDGRDRSGRVRTTAADRAKAAAAAMAADSNQASVSSELHVTLRAVGVSLVDSEPVEFAYARFDKLEVRTSVAAHGGGASYELLLGSLCIDNQLLHTPFPVLLRPIERPQAEAQQSKDVPFVHVSVVRDARHAALDFYKYIAVRVGEVG